MKTIKYREGYKYQLAADYVTYTGILTFDDVEMEFLSLSKDGILTIFSGYAWDGPSGPAFDTPSFMRASLVHDALYQLMRNELIPSNRWRRKADKLMREICLDDGMWGPRAWWCYRAVKRFACSSASPKNAKPTIEAP